MPRWRLGMPLLVGIVCFPLLLACGPSDKDRLLHDIVAERAKQVTAEVRRDIVEAVVRAERRTGVDALLLLSMVEEESNFKPRARSRRGALGLLQVRAATGKDVAKRHGISWDGETSLLEPRVNILIGATYVSELRARFGSWDLALTAYNRGPTKTKRLARKGVSPSSRYAARVLRRFEAWRREIDG